ncbi:MAG: energy transducer TonB [Proteobacteria bacterium]|nr:energy transducer TonB [Pseudomonadota bacterium]
MAHAITASSSRYDHMSPVAAALAAVLHVATALALFLVSPLNRHDVDVDNAIDVTIEQPKPPEPPPQEAVKPTPPPQPPAVQPAPPPPPPAAQARRPEPKLQPQPTPKEQIGLPPETPVEPDAKKTEAKPAPVAEARLEPKPEPPPEPKLEPKPEAAAHLAEPAPPPVEAKPLEKVLPPVEQPAAPLTMRDFVKALPRPPASPPSPPAHHTPPPQQHPQQPQPSPLSQRSPPTEQRQASVSAFQNPADAYNHAREHDDYLVGIARRMSQYRFVPQSMKGLNAQGVVVLSLVVARDGRLLNSSIARSSGNRTMDVAVLETAQKAAPYGPLPPAISGNSATFTLSVPYRFVAEQ